MTADQSPGHRLCQCNISLAGNLQPHPSNPPLLLLLLIPLSHASTRHSSICPPAVRSDPCLLRSLSKPMGEPLPPPQQQCAAPLPNGPEEEALRLDHPAIDPIRQPPMQTSADAAAASTHADRQTEAPAFWSTRHARTTSYNSISHLSPGTIQLEDHSEEQHEQSQGCWARSVTVDDHTVVSGTSGVGAYVVWHLTVSTLKGGDMSIRKRYVLEFCCHVPRYHCITCMRYVIMFTFCTTANLHVVYLTLPTLSHNLRSRSCNC